MIISDAVDAALADERNRTDLERLQNQRDGYFWPSELSAAHEVAPGIMASVGGCRRKVFYRWKRLPPTNPVSPRSIRRMMIGKIIEQQEIAWYKQAGLLIASNAKFQNPKRFVSGELDALVYDPDCGVVGMEVKTYFGYNAEREIEGNKSRMGFPRLDNLIQTMVYLSEMRLPQFRLLYINRGSVMKTEFAIRLNEHGYAMVKNLHRPYQTTFMGFSLPDVYQRAQVLRDMITAGSLPPCDFQESYSANEIKARFDNGLISKTMYGEHVKSGVSVGDWQCGPDYCQQYDRCVADGRQAAS